MSGSSDVELKSEFALKVVTVAIAAAFLMGVWDLLHHRFLPAAVEGAYLLLCLGLRWGRRGPGLDAWRRIASGLGISAVAIFYGYDDPTRVEHLVWLPLFPVCLVLSTVWREAATFMATIALAHVGLYTGWWQHHGAWPVPPATLIETAVVYGLSVAVAGRFEAVALAQLRKLEHLAETDTLTGIANRRSFFRAAEREQARARRHGGPWSVVWLDVDHFKSVNDRFGHDTGDRVLRAIAQVLRTQLREIDLVARVGGEEFAVLLPETSVRGAAIVAHRLRASCAQVREGVPSVTCSFGVAQANGAEDVAAVLQRADTALYQAKEGGRNRVVIAEADLQGAAEVLEAAADKPRPPQPALQE